MIAGERVFGQGDSESWEEKIKAGASTNQSLPGGVPSVAPSPTDDSPSPKPKATDTPKPSPTIPPTPDPAKFKTANEYACAVTGSKGATTLDPVTKESEADKARRAWESAKTDRSKKGGRPVPPPYSMPPYPAGATPYMKQCIDGGVPVPPKWGDDRWVKQGNLDSTKGQVFASSLPTTEVWTYKSSQPEGICYALPRIDAGGTIQLLGQICQGSKTGKACFWDNLDPANPTMTGRKPVNDSSGPDNMAGADVMDLPEGEQCTECHRGDNVFNIHPNTPLRVGPTDPCSTDGPGDFPVDDRPTDAAKKPYQPIVGPKFKNKNDPLVPPLKNTACTGCHSIPKLTKGYCSTVVGKAIGNTMPPPDGKMNAEEQKSADEIKDRCSKL